MPKEPKDDTQRTNYRYFVNIDAETDAKMQIIADYINALKPNDPLFPVPLKPLEDGTYGITDLVECCVDLMIHDLPSIDINLTAIFEQYNKMYVLSRSATMRTIGRYDEAFDQKLAKISHLVTVDMGIVIKPKGKHNKPNHKFPIMFAIYYAYDYVAKKQK